jgi:predicted nucleotidyltransferase
MNYLSKLKASAFDFSEAWLFGSYARGNQHIHSDIDLAIVLKENIIHNFDTEVQLMVLRNGEETMIEPHTFSKDEFNIQVPLVSQIIKYGIRLEV